MKLYIAYSERQRYKKEARALYYSKKLGKHKIFRSYMLKNESKEFKLIAYKQKKRIQRICDNINKKYNDDFKPILYEDVKVTDYNDLNIDFNYSVFTVEELKAIADLNKVDLNWMEMEALMREIELERRRKSSTENNVDVDVDFIFK
ncbi:MAG: hypothetical protein M0Q88_01030 [Bacilli bacterium]|nr:hypothetical protein [Bacilli bacterium]